MSHTPGPWILKQTGDGKAILINGGHVGEVHSDDIDTYEAWSNANLIAAAPEMLEALESSLNALEELNSITSDEWFTTTEIIKVAINKAKGL